MIFNLLFEKPPLSFFLVLYKALCFLETSVRFIFMIFFFIYCGIEWHAQHDTDVYKAIVESFCGFLETKISFFLFDHLRTLAVFYILILYVGVLLADQVLVIIIEEKKVALSREKDKNKKSCFSFCIDGLFVLEIFLWVKDYIDALSHYEYVLCLCGFFILLNLIAAWYRWKHFIWSFTLVFYERIHLKNSLFLKHIVIFHMRFLGKLRKQHSSRCKMRPVSLFFRCIKLCDHGGGGGYPCTLPCQLGETSFVR